ncbi:hypothetical protein Acsp04_46720 [Actinomadura sp. NBRC 104425]|uniref:hypothetical protein n=1 Tax=Actinomadura sp. NBRC 104425 TaxID=3032204 RepID=UPI0024A55F3C|nr:hypothetical protein [Actinomadura sp. NBRC 104425]GLZ14437.1 hypothetical protein Acsp04_46720 [Actinomadura sp. NBRC 104425]
MNKTTIAATALAFTALALPTTPGIAQATTVNSPGTISTAAVDGYFYAWENRDHSGDWCRWPSGVDDPDWSTCSGSSPNVNMNGKASALANLGYPGTYDDVDLYFSSNYLGSGMCVRNGLYISLLTVYFPWDGKRGQGQWANDNITSHRWSNNC